MSLLGQLVGLALLFLVFSRSFREHALRWLVPLVGVGAGIVLLLSWLAEHLTAIVVVAALVLVPTAFLRFRRHRQALDRLFVQASTSLKRRVDR